MAGRTPPNTLQRWNPRSEQKEHVRAANAGSAEMNVRADDVLDVRGNLLSAAGCCRV
jgi:hypothetical protein